MTRVRVYWNLHKKIWSIQDKKTRRVVEHRNELALRDVRFIVSEAGRHRVLRTKQKNVHAYAEGVLVDKRQGTRRVSYNPYKSGSFYLVGCGTPVYEAPFCIMTKSGVFI